MFKLGQTQELEVVKVLDFGCYLSEDSMGFERVLLPRKQVPTGTVVGNILEVFIYKDSQDRLIATTNTPLITLGKTALLKVKAVSRIGAFLDWGLEKDLLLPYKEQSKSLKEGDEVLVGLYVDKSERLCATMDVYKYLKLNAPYQIGDELKARIYELHPRYGVYVAVEDTYSGIIPKREAQGTFNIGDVITVRVTKVKEDGRVDVTPRKKAYLQMGPDAEMILDRIKDLHGVLPFDDRTDPEVINKEFGLSKAAFKRAVGHLLKEGKIEIKEGKIYLK